MYIKIHQISHQMVNPRKWIEHKPAERREPLVQNLQTLPRPIRFQILQCKWMTID